MLNKHPKFDRAVANQARHLDALERARRAAPLETLDEVVTGRLPIKDDVFPAGLYRKD